MPKAYGSLIDTETRCRHYFTEEDIIATKSKRCNKYHPCYKCHNEPEKHAIKRWSEPSFNEKVILCGVCKHELTISEYMMVECCPNCQSRLNNRCKHHHHIYLEV